MSVWKDDFRPEIIYDHIELEEDETEEIEEEKGDE